MYFRSPRDYVRPDPSWYARPGGGGAPPLVGQQTAFGPPPAPRQPSGPFAGRLDEVLGGGGEGFSGSSDINPVVARMISALRGAAPQPTPKEPESAPMDRMISALQERIPSRPQPSPIQSVTPPIRSVTPPMTAMRPSPAPQPSVTDALRRALSSRGQEPVSGSSARLRALLSRR